MSEWIYTIDGDWPDYDHCPKDLEEVLFCLWDELRDGVQFHVGCESYEHGETFCRDIKGDVSDRVIAFLRFPDIDASKITQNTTEVEESDGE